MSVFKRAALILALLTGLAVFAYAETSYSLSLGYYRLSEQFFADDYGRGHNGANANFTFYYFPENTVLGFLFRTSFGVLGTGYEFRGNQMQAMEPLSSFDVRLALAPSYRFSLGSKVTLPLSLGLAFELLWEDTSMSWDYSNSSYYEAMNLGAFLDASIVIAPFKIPEQLFLKQGISIGCDFLHFERGEMLSVYRRSANARYQFTPYSAFVLSVFFGVGVKFD